ncbi:MAG: hypothetical protein IPF51_12260 [Dehalococcoidia bacterium]|nr:hypothetical protein [Dehalococcoidia bacterium]
MEAQVEALICYRIISMQERGEIPNKESSIAKLYSSELDVRLASTAMHLGGLFSQIMDRDDASAMGGKFARFYMHSTTSPIGGGTSEYSGTSSRCGAGPAARLTFGRCRPGARFRRSAEKLHRRRCAGPLVPAARRCRPGGGRSGDRALPATTVRPAGAEQALFFGQLAGRDGHPRQRAAVSEQASRRSATATAKKTTDSRAVRSGGSPPLRH